MPERTNLPVRFILDSDGFLVDTENLSREIIVQVAEVLAGAKDLNIGPYVKVGGKYIARIAHDLGIGHLALSFRDQVHNEIEAQIRHLGSSIVMPGIPTLIEDFRSMGVELGVGSQTATRSTRERLEIAGLAHNFTVIAGSDQVREGKPNPALFHYVARGLGANPRMCGVLGDSDWDSIAARRAGMMVGKVSPESYEGPAAFKPHFQVASANQLDARALVEVVRSRY